MRLTGCLVLVAFLTLFAAAQNEAAGPINEKAKKTYEQALDYVHQRMTAAALESFKKADKQDDGHCLACQKKMVKYGIELREWKTAEAAAEEEISEAQGVKDIALAHFLLGRVFMEQGLEKNKEELFSRAHDEMTRALATVSNFPDAIFEDGLILAHLKQDDAAKKQFEQFVSMKSDDDPNRLRALRYISDPDLARARMAPAFTVTTTNGERVSLDELKGRVVLIDFWATWCGPCREALPHMKEIAKKFQGQPLVVLSISLDDDEKKWREFVAKNEMTWLQYRDGGFKGPIATMFAVNSIPQTFTIDSNGVLQDQHIGDAAIEGKLKKLVSRVQTAKAANQ